MKSGESGNHPGEGGIQEKDGLFVFSKLKKYKERMESPEIELRSQNEE